MNNKSDHIKSKNLCLPKDSIKSEKTSYTVGEDFCNTTNEGLTCRIYNKLQMNKMRLEQALHKRGYPNGQSKYEERFNHIGNYKNAN